MLVPLKRLAFPEIQGAHYMVFLLKAMHRLVGDLFCDQVNSFRRLEANTRR